MRGDSLTQISGQSITIGMQRNVGISPTELPDKNRPTAIGKANYTRCVLRISPSGLYPLVHGNGGAKVSSEGEPHIAVAKRRN